MILRDKSGREVVPGDQLTNSRGDTVYLRSIDKPRHAGSTGRVHVVEDPHDVTSDRGAFESAAFYPSVFGLEWEGRTDQGQR